MKVSVVLCVYNGDDYLLECLDSLEGQSHDDFEMIIVNDGSDDLTHAIITDFIERTRLKVTYINQTNMGLTKSLNIAITHSSGEFIMRQDADDISSKDRISSCVEYMEQNTDVDLIVTSFRRFTDNECIDSKNTLPRYFKDNTKITFNHIKYGNPFCHGSFFGRAEHFSNLFYNEELQKAQDFEFLLRSLKLNAKIIFCDIDTYSLRIHENSISNRFFESQVAYAETALRVNGFTTCYYIPNSNKLYKIILRALRFFEAKLFWNK